ncbi:tRNA-uridine aminocarboxypropyltransferase [Salinivibrio kushneri]|uniref:tRNA-uridine aminocarboxypropyltransferase n=1 Tax=Salinivibrio kushneri TaxID=1908198 RepID=A0AA47KJD1_9GAMM|nr:tRNA-uridine aminocarboxypropyltransferase [Salinivibrio kushneri]WBA08005.1 DTW domain-containing protein [Salinivibrio kushneri]
MSRYCSLCHKAHAICICDAITKIDNPNPVILLQHPDEVSHPKNSACLLSLSLQHSITLVGEDFSQHPQLNALLADPDITYAVLYPEEYATPLGEVVTQPAGAKQGIILLDGTWKKAYKMYQLSTNLQALPSISIDAKTPSQYQIRKSRKPGALSTLEAGYMALSQLEGNAKRYQPLLDSFDTMIARQLAFLPDASKRCD